MILRTVNLGHVAWLTVGLTASAAGFGAVSGLAEPASVAAGGAFMLANFGLLRMLVSRLSVPGASKTSGLMVVGMKFLLFLLLIAGVVFRLPIAAGSFALGATMLLVASVLEAALLGDPVGPIEEVGPETDEG